MYASSKYQSADPGNGENIEFLVCTLPSKSGDGKCGAKVLVYGKGCGECWQCGGQWTPDLVGIMASGDPILSETTAVGER